MQCNIITPFIVKYLHGMRKSGQITCDAQAFVVDREALYECAPLYLLLFQCTQRTPNGAEISKRKIYWIA